MSRMIRSVFAVIRRASAPRTVRSHRVAGLVRQMHEGLLGHSHWLSGLNGGEVSPKMNSRDPSHRAFISRATSVPIPRRSSSTFSTGLLPMRSAIQSMRSALRDGLGLAGKLVTAPATIFFSVLARRSRAGTRGHPPARSPHDRGRSPRRRQWRRTRRPPHPASTRRSTPPSSCDIRVENDGDRQAVHQFRQISVGDPIHGPGEQPPIPTTSHFGAYRRPARVCFVPSTISTRFGLTTGRRTLMTGFVPAGHSTWRSSRPRSGRGSRAGPARPPHP